MSPELELDFHDDPRAFLDVAGELLGADPLLGTVVGSVTARFVDKAERGRRPRDSVDGAYDPWWLVVRDDRGRVVSAAMRTAPFVPYPTYCLPMPDDAAVALARALHTRGEELRGSNGALPAAQVLAEETARLVGGAVSTAQHMRLFEATAVTVPEAPEGTLRPATADDADLALAWFRAFGLEADEQAGREPGTMHTEAFSREDVLDRIDAGTVWLFETAGGEVAHLSAVGLPAYGVSRIGPVYTPKDCRGRGIASYVVAELTRRGLEAGHRMCLFTDQANPTSNKIYEALGYRRVVDMANLEISTA